MKYSELVKMDTEILERRRKIREELWQLDKVCLPREADADGQVKDSDDCDREKWLALIEQEVAVLNEHRKLMQEYFGKSE